MPVRIHVPAPTDPSTWDELRTELGVSEAFPPEAEAEAAAVAASLPDGPDRTDVELCTIDPPGSRDLDQAVGFERDGDEYLVRYAIADVATFVVPGGALDAESHRRGETLYGPDRRVPMLPPTLSEGAASLLPDVERPALLWELRLDAAGELLTTTVARGRVRSRRQLTYQEVQAVVDGSIADEQLLLLREVGLLRMTLASRRGAVDLPSLEQEVRLDDDGRPRLSFRASLESERWNAQISLLTGMAAARLMIDGGIGILRTLPAPLAADVEELRRSALALGVAWPEGTPHGEVVSGLDPHVGAEAALLALVPRILRGAAYLAFDGELSADHQHSGIAAAYAHCTAPLRRLVDRYAGEVCLALCAGESVPDWVRQALPTLPEEMAGADRRANALERATLDLAEAIVLSGCVGATLPGVVVTAEGDRGIVQLPEPAVRASLTGPDLKAGAKVDVVVKTADPATRTVELTLA